MSWKSIAVSFAVALLALPSVVFAQVKVDPALPEYKGGVAGVSGNIKSVGSDTMNNLMTYWQEGFHKFYPGVQFEVDGKGSGTAPPALIAGTATFGPMSRPMKPAEIDAFEKKFGYPPTGLATSIDMLAVFVNKDNPLASLTFPQVDAMFSSTRKLGHANEIRTWAQAGLKGEWASIPISLYGRNSASGTHVFFKEKALGDGDFSPRVKEQPGSGAVVQAIGSDKSAIGYSGIGYDTPDVKPLSLAKDEKGTPVVPEAANAYNGKYPLARPLILYVNHKPGTPLDPLRREFIKFVFSKQGQESVVKDGFVPVTAKMATEVLKKIETTK